MKVNVGIVGVGNCASSLVQGMEYYKDAGEDAVGLTRPVCAGYAISDVEFTCAFDVDASKVGKDLSAAIWASPNNSLEFARVGELGVTVSDGVLADGVGPGSAARITALGRATLDDIVRCLKASDTHVLVNFLPVGSQKASEIYAEAALRAGAAFINCMPAVIARSVEWSRRFEEAGVPLIGDDLKSQFGATLVHRSLIDVLAKNGVKLRNTYQIVSGGNMDFWNMQDPEKVKSKEATKVHGMMGGSQRDAERPGTHFGAEYVPFLKDRKIAFIRIEGEAFGRTPLEIELRMAVEDSPSAAGNVLDAVRLAKYALDRGLGGMARAASALLMKAAPVQMPEAEVQAELTKMLEPKRN